MLKIDALDKKILFELDLNSRQSISELSRKVKYGRDIVEYRIDRLIKEGVIQKFTATVNPYALGKTIYKCYLKLKNQPPEIRRLLNSIGESKKIYCYTLCHGTFDLIYTIMASSPFEFSQIESELISKHKEIILSNHLGVIVSYSCYPRRYLSLKSKEVGVTIGGEPFTSKIDSIDSILLQELSLNSRITTKELSEKAGVSTPNITSRLGKYEAQNIIAGYRIELNASLLGYSSYKIQLELFFNDAQSLKKVKSTCDKIPWVTKFISQIGTPRIECNIDAENHTHFNQILSQIKEELAEIIQSVSTVMVRDEKVYGAQIDGNAGTNLYGDPFYSI